MVALLVLLTIITFLVVDGVVLSVKARRAPAAAPVFEHGLVFAQDGGEPVDAEPAEEEDAPEDPPA